MTQTFQDTAVASKVSKDRLIVHFPQPFLKCATPYTELTFHSSVKTVCEQEKAAVTSLRVSKVVIVGNVSVGKTSVVQKFCHNTFCRDYKATIGVDFEVEKLSVLSIPFTLQIWDTAGQERFKCIAASYYRGAQALLVAFDLSDISSLESTRQWMLDAVSVMQDPFVFLVGLKRDLISDAAFENLKEDCIRVAKDLSAEFWATSAKTGENIRELFFRVAALIFNRQVLADTAVDASVPSKKMISSSTIKVDKEAYQSDDLFDKIRKPKCCS